MQAYLTTAEAAKALGMTAHSIRKLVADGKLAVHYLGPNGGMIRFTEADLELYLESCRVFGSRVASRRGASRDRAKHNGKKGSGHRPYAQAAELLSLRQPLASEPPSQTTRENNGD